MADRDYDDEQHVVGDRIDDAIVADPHTKGRPAAQATRGRRTRVFREKGDRPLDALADLRIELVQRADGGRAQLDAVAAHSQPRSALA